jgi:spermidine synthase
MSEESNLARIKRLIWPLSRNKVRYLLRRLRHPYRRLYLTHSPINGPMSVWELGRERHLLFSESLTYPQSIIFTRGSYAELAREFWGKLLPPARLLPPHPRVLLLGLGGGTVVQLAYRLLQPQSITIVELDPVVVDIAKRYMLMDQIPNLEIHTTDVHQALAEFQNGRPFDLIIEDIFYLGLPDQNDTILQAYIQSLVAILAPEGFLTFNRWISESQEERMGSLLRLLEERFTRVHLQKMNMRYQVQVISASQPKL